MNVAISTRFRRAAFRILQFAAGVLLGTFSLEVTAKDAVSAYRLQAGDVVEVSIFGFPELRQIVPVQRGGAIALAVAGRIQVAGLTASGLQEKVSAELAQHPIRNMRPGGRDQLIYLQSANVTVSIAKFRPILVNGDVLNPGEFEYRPEMTARHAVILAGGISLTRRGELPVRYDPIDLERDYRTLSLEVARVQVRLWRLAAEKEGGSRLERLYIGDLPVSETVIAAFERSENELLHLGLKEAEQERLFTLESIQRIEQQITVLTAQDELDQMAVDAERVEHAQVDALVQRGTASRARSLDTRRAVMQSTSQRMQTNMLLMQSRLQLDELKSRLARMENKRKMSVLRQIGEDNVRLEDYRMRLSAVADKLQFSRNMPALSGRDAGRQASFLIVRRTETGLQRLNGEDDAELQPGDVVEVTLQITNLLSLGSN